MTENKDTVSMEIIKSDKYNRTNIRFNGKPSKEIREELKNEGWFYSRNHNLWYPKNDVAKSSGEFASHIKETYFPDGKEVKFITETKEKSELSSMIETGSSLNDILSKLSDMYGKDAVHEAFLNAKESSGSEISFLRDTDPFLSELALFNTQNGEYLYIQQSDENGWNYTLYTKDFHEIDGGVSDDVPDSKEKIDIRSSAISIIKDIKPSSDLSNWVLTDELELQVNVERVENEKLKTLKNNTLRDEGEELERQNGRREMEETLTPHEKEIHSSQTKLGDIIRVSLLTLTEDEKESGISLEGKNRTYETWYRPMVDEIMEEIKKGDKDLIKIISDFNTDPESHIEGNSWYTGEEALTRDVKYKLLPALYEKIQNKIIKEYEDKKIPYVVLYSSESSVFPSENKVYTVKDFNEKLLKADSDFHNRKKYAEKKYGSADNYWDLEKDDKLPEEDKGIQFGYDKTNFKFFNIPNPADPEDTFSYEPSRYDIGDGNGSVFDYVRSTCSHDSFIKAMDALEVSLYFPNVTEEQKSFVKNTVEKEAETLKKNLKEKLSDLDKAQEEYKELHKKWLIEASEADLVDDKLSHALKNIKDTYESSMKNAFDKVLKEYPFITKDEAGNEFLRFSANEVKNMVVSELYLPSREAQKAMNNEDYKAYNSVDWAKLRRIWEQFPSNVNMYDYSNSILEGLCKEKEKSYKNEKESQPSLFKVENSETVSDEDLSILKKLIPASQLKYTMELSKGEEGSFYVKKMKEIADIYRKINTDEELINDDGSHLLSLRYFQGNTEILISEIDTDGIAFGYNILGGDIEMSEWGSTSLEEIVSVPGMELDYHIPEGTTIEEHLYSKDPKYFKEYAPKAKPYSFYIDDVANLDLGIGSEIDEITGLSARDAVKKYAELKSEGFNPYIGLHIEGDIVFDDKEEKGAPLFCEIEGEESFYIGESFVKDLKEENQRSELIIKAYKDLYEETSSYLDNVKRPDFVFDKEQRLKEHIKSIDVYTFSPFGYEGSLVKVETDLRPGIPAFDIVGISDASVNETRERIRSAFDNSGLSFPDERVLQALSPADIRKDSPLDLSMALGILSQKKTYPLSFPVLALGELELSGKVRPVRAAVAAVNNAKENGITHVVCDSLTADLLKGIEGISILEADSLKEADEKLMSPDSFIKTDPKLYNAPSVVFNEELIENYKEALSNLPYEGNFETVRAIQIAAAGKHNILTTGSPGCGKTMFAQTLLPSLTPLLTDEEAETPKRIASIAGLDSPDRDIHIAPFRMPHQTASIEGICGGGPACRPGEITLSHKGTLFFDEASEFRSSVLQMLRVPLESKSITLSRAGRSTTYPADFQLALSMNPCPCGCYNSPNKICLDSARSLEMYWKKISDPLLDRIEIKIFMEKDENDKRKMSFDDLKAQVKTAFEIQRKRGIYNSHLTADEIEKYCKLDDESKEYLSCEEDFLTARGKQNLLKLSLTIANMDGRDEIHINDIKEAREISAPVFEKPRKFSYNPESKKIPEKLQDEKLKLDDANISLSQIESAGKERDKIISPVLNGEKSGMYKAFKDFEDKGVFDIQGTHLNLSKNGGLTPTGWKQLQAAMEIYRSKKFETFRYILIDRHTGEIQDQLAITSHMPNFCNVSRPNDETLKQVISRAEEKDLLIAVCHNHPSGNTTESSFDRELTDSLDRSLRRNDGLNRFLGHIILDHDSFNLGLPSEKRSGKCHWKKMEPFEVSKEDRLNELEKPDWLNKTVGGTNALKDIAVKINDSENWNDDFIPVVFTNAERNISALQYYSKSFFENDSDKIRSEFQSSSIEAGAIGAFPVITDSLWEKLGSERENFENIMKGHVLHDAFTDVSFNHTTMTEKHDIEAGKNYYSFFRSESPTKIDVSSTWVPEVNTKLFPKEETIER